MKNAHVDQLGTEVGHHAGQDDPPGITEYLVIDFVLDGRVGYRFKGVAQPQDK